MMIDISILRFIYFVYKPLPGIWNQHCVYTFRSNSGDSKVSKEPWTNTVQQTFGRSAQRGVPLAPKLLQTLHLITIGADMLFSTGWVVWDCNGRAALTAKQAG
eukprot:6468570-Amphidinium_carterae.1